jgi:uncharacterized protein YggE
MLHRSFCLLVVGVVLAWFVDPASAESGANGTVSASGKARLLATPSKLRMQVELRCYGSTVATALKNLKIRRDAATAQLKKLSADPASICFSIPRAGTPQATTSSPSVTYSIAVPAASWDPYATGGSVPSPPNYSPPSTGAPILTPPQPTDAPPVAEPAESTPFRSQARNATAKPRQSLFMATTLLKAEWPLEGTDADAVVAAAEAIRQNVASIDMTAAKAAHNRLSPEEQELAEEAEMRRPRPFDPSVPTPASLDARPQPTFVYVAVLSNKQRKALLAEACRAAKKSAAELAEVAGVKLGAIASLQSNFNNPRGAFTPLGPEQASLMANGSESEAVAATPDGLDFECYVSLAHHVLTAEAKP